MKSSSLNIQPSMSELIEFDTDDELDDSNKTSLVTEESVERRQIHIIDEITKNSFEQIKNLYDELVEDNQEKPIHFVIGSPGGEASSMLGIMNLILISKTPCYTYLLSETCSAGAWVYLCGHKRFAPRTNLVSFMLHPLAWGMDSEALGTHNAYNKYLENLSNKLIAFTVKQTRIPIRRLKKLATSETQFFIGEELFEQGIATDELTTASFWLDPEKKKNTSPKLTEDCPQTLLD
jgi:ATP-dependent protease ClpP protease subunit